MVSNCCGAAPVHEIPIDGWGMCGYCGEMTDFISEDEPINEEETSEGQCNNKNNE